MNDLRPVLSAEAMRAADAFTIDEFGIPGFTLMESAGRGTALLIERLMGSVNGNRVNIYCGKGNNGGDGYVIARYLFDKGARVHVISIGEPHDLRGDAKSNYGLLQKLHDFDDRLSLTIFNGVENLSPADIHIDALLGTGLTSELRDPILGLVNWLNEQSGIKVAVDLPTGLHSDLGTPLGSAFHADWTFTMAALKTGHCVNHGKETCGRIEVVDIGIPRFALEGPVAEGKPTCAWLPTDEAVRSWLPRRSYDANKYSVGLAMVIAGSAGMTGAPVMASTAAARIGAGYVMCACDQRIQSTLGVKMTEITTVPLPAGQNGINPDGGMDALRTRLDKTKGALIGCGLGRDPDTRAFVRRFLAEVDLPVVVDADGLNALVDHTDLIKEHAHGRWILTPHMGEFRRLAGDDLHDVHAGNTGGAATNVPNTVALAQHFAAKWNCILVLKGLPSVVATPGGTAYINATGGPSLASAGTGDVLAGLCAGLVAQGMNPERAAVAALHIGGAAADAFSSRFDGRSLQATDIIDELPSVLKQRFSHSS